jgi:hypothetical protein
MPNEHPEILARTVPDPALEGVVSSVAKKLSTAQQMHLTSAAGTDLRVNLKNGDIQAVVGGVWGFFPSPAWSRTGLRASRWRSRRREAFTARWSWPR